MRTRGPEPQPEPADGNGQTRDKEVIAWEVEERELKNKREPCKEDNSENHLAVA